MPTVRHTSFLLRKVLTFGTPKSTVLVIIFRVFIWMLSFKNAGKIHYPYAQFRNGISRKRTISSYNKSMNNGTSSSSSDNETTPKVKKSFGINFNAKFGMRMKTRCELIIEADNELFQIRTKKPTFVLFSFQQFISSKLDRLSLQQLECEMDSADYPDKYNFFELVYCGHPQYPYSKIFLDQASDLKLSHFKEEDHSFIIDALRNEKTQLVSLYYLYKPKTNTSITKNTNDDENAYKFCPLNGNESTGFNRHMISVVVFSHSETLESMLVEYAATEMVLLDDYSDAAPKGKSIRGNGINKFILYFAQCIIFNKKIALKQHLLPMHC